jgi:hypothetical protein
MAFKIHGIGTMVYGERDYWPDGSFFTTEWFVVAYVPISPSVSMRISYTRNNPFPKYDSAGYYIYESKPVNRKQVLSTYLWFGSLISLFVLIVGYQDSLVGLIGDSDKAAELWLVLLGTILVLPYLLRRLAKRRKMQKWKRMNAGLQSPVDEE